jgi:hypothetical protein
MPTPVLEDDADTAIDFDWVCPQVRRPGADSAVDLTAEAQDWEGWCRELVS